VTFVVAGLAPAFHQKEFIRRMMELPGIGAKEGELSAMLIGHAP